MLSSAPLALRLRSCTVLPLTPALPTPVRQRTPSFMRAARCPFSASPTTPASCSSQKQKQKQRDPYALAQARQRKAANLARREVLQKERAAALGDPVRGNTTPFIESLDLSVSSSAPTSSHPAPLPAPSATDATTPSSSTPPEPYLNHYVSGATLLKSLEKSHLLTQPIAPSNRGTADPALEEEEARRHRERHANAECAMRRIVALENGSRMDRTRVNIQRCIETFGRHKTDAHLAPRPAATVPRDPSLPPLPEKTPRAGPDTGSPEVQIAILTTRIRVLANHLDTIGRKDKVNKRNLRVLVHKRQKLLAYLRRKERGGERWQNVLNSLGLADSAWKGEITLR
ncbi:MAG: hypothetical protein M1838_005319 [Thelocarpon superellum]|nr:MAG: hypothetical protein M1838_005319 [Thelocarpon superellum]